MFDMVPAIKIGRFSISADQDPFVIAELSGNHNHELGRALELVKAAAEAGAHALKLQTYTADTMTIDVRDGQFLISDPTSPWYGETLYRLYQKAHTPWEWHKPIFDLAAELGMVAFSSPFDRTAVDYLEALDAPAYKIASFELTDHQLVAYVAKTGKPIIMSTGMASIVEISESVAVARANGCRDLVLLKCTSSYPSTAENANLATIPVLRQTFDCQVGLSDHSLGLAVPAAAVALGATVIEKHLTLRRADGGVDSAFSLEPVEFADMVRTTREARLAIGQPTFGASTSEVTSKSHRRSLYIVKDIKAGEIVTEEHVRSIRPGGGLPIKFLKTILGMEARRDAARGEPLSWNLFRSNA